MGSRRPSKKLDDKKAGPFPISKVVGEHAFHVQLLESSQEHPTFHVQLLEAYQVSHEESRRQRPSTPETIDGAINYIVCELIERRKNNKKMGNPIEYLVLLEGYSDEE